MTERMELVRATAGDVEAVRTLTRSAYASWVPVIGREPMPMNADYAVAIAQHRIDLLFVDGVLAALIELIPTDDSLLIENLAVAPSFARRGFGRTLMAHAERVAASLGYATIVLYTNELMASNVAYYERLGYTIDRVEEIRPGWRVVHLRKVLTPYD
jgi:ribosomal protein S18 acetylase RimI-like enzyme